TCESVFRPRSIPSSCPTASTFRPRIPSNAQGVRLSCRFDRLFSRGHTTGLDTQDYFGPRNTRCDLLFHCLDCLSYDSARRRNLHLSTTYWVGHSQQRRRILSLACPHRLGSRGS